MTVLRAFAVSPAFGGWDGAYIDDVFVFDLRNVGPLLLEQPARSGAVQAMTVVLRQLDDKLPEKLQRSRAASQEQLKSQNVLSFSLCTGSVYWQVLLVRESPRHDSAQTRPAPFSSKSKPFNTPCQDSKDEIGTCTKNTRLQVKFLNGLEFTGKRCIFCMCRPEMKP